MKKAGIFILLFCLAAFLSFNVDEMNVDGRDFFRFSFVGVAAYFGAYYAIARGQKGSEGAEGTRARDGSKKS
jgi:drug/metabolite transporter (DMT)-like permease